VRFGLLPVMLGLAGAPAATAQLAAGETIRFVRHDSLVRGVYVSGDTIAVTILRSGASDPDRYPIHELSRAEVLVGQRKAGGVRAGQGAVGGLLTGMAVGLALTGGSQRGAAELRTAFTGVLGIVFGMIGAVAGVSGAGELVDEWEPLDLSHALGLRALGESR
jgi:hypothetical protein